MTPAPTSTADQSDSSNADADSRSSSPGSSSVGNTAPLSPMPDSQVQANQVLAQVSAMIGAALSRIRVTSGDPNTFVHSGYPCTVITTERPRGEG